MYIVRKTSFAFIMVFIVASMPVYAGKANVVAVEVKKNTFKPNSYDFSVSIRHEDAGWKHYANKWEVIGSDNKVYGTRVLLHPHDNEQPFTRSLKAVQIPSKIKSVTIKASDLKHGAGGKSKVVPLP